MQLPSTKYGRGLKCLEGKKAMPVSPYSDGNGRPYNVVDDYETVAAIWSDLFPAAPCENDGVLRLPKDAPENLVRCNPDMVSEIVPNTALGSQFNWPRGWYIVVEGGPLRDSPMAIPGDDYSLRQVSMRDATLGFTRKTVQLVNLFLHLDVVNHVMTYSLACVEWPGRCSPYDQGLVAGPFQYDGGASEEQLELLESELIEHGYGAWYHIVDHSAG